MSELRELYQQLILDHNRSPKNKRAIETNRHAPSSRPGKVMRAWPGSRPPR